MKATAKRSFDLVVAGTALLVLAPVLCVLAVLVWLKLGRPVIFRQTRPGLNGTPFELIKFRTMTDQRDLSGRLLPDDVRLTSFGHLLRSTSADELPELWNVLNGQMSLVGPRPLLMEYLGRYSARQRRRLEVKPGITGWAQVNGRNALTWNERFELDVWYVDNHSLLLDLRILGMTLIQVARRKGISAEGHATMPEFVGEDANTEKR